MYIAGHGKPPQSGIIEEEILRLIPLEENLLFNDFSIPNNFSSTIHRLLQATPANTYHKNQKHNRNLQG